MASNAEKVAVGAGAVALILILGRAKPQSVGTGPQGSPSGQPAVPSLVTVSGPSGKVKAGPQTLAVTLANPGTAAAMLAAEAVIVDSNGIIRAVWKRAGSPGGCAADSPACYQASGTAQAGGTVTLKFSLNIASSSTGPYTTIVWYDALPSGYAGPLVTGKVVGGSSS